MKKIKYRSPEKSFTFANLTEWSSIFGNNYITCKIFRSFNFPANTVYLQDFGQISDKFRTHFGNLLKLNLRQQITNQTGTTAVKTIDKMTDRENNKFYQAVTHFEGSCRLRPMASSPPHRFNLIKFAPNQIE